MKSIRILSSVLATIAQIACHSASNHPPVTTAAGAKVAESVIAESPSLVDPRDSAQTAELNQLIAVGSELYGQSAKDLRKKIGELQPQVLITNLNGLPGLISLAQQEKNDRQCKILETISNARPYTAVLYIRKHKQGVTFAGLAYTMFKLNTDKNFKDGFEITVQCEAKLGSTMTFGDISAEFGNSLQFISGVTN